ncbi:MAG TPA: hypothetical protein VHQ65_16590, partial [Thermoanaerobaculia bacterium]|nr:hypothetical protein [Thermoanaerobaculia bacterium]
GIGLAPGPGRAVPLAWHPTLPRYGAGELNERFTTATGEAMDEPAWYGWVAVKLVVEAALRGRALADAAIDGHKGRPLAFVDGVLRQPLYVAIERDGEVEVVDG